MRYVVCILAVGLIGVVIAQEAPPQEKPTTLIGLLSQQEALAYRVENSGYVVRILSPELLTQSRDYFVNLEVNIRKQELLMKRRSELRAKELNRLDGAVDDAELRRRVMLLQEALDDKTRENLPPGVQERLANADNFLAPIKRGISQRALQQFVKEDPEMLKLKTMLEKATQPLIGFRFADVTRSGTDFLGLRDMESNGLIM